MAEMRKTTLPLCQEEGGDNAGGQAFGSVSGLLEHPAFSQRRTWWRVLGRPAVLFNLLNGCKVKLASLALSHGRPLGSESSEK